MQMKVFCANEEDNENVYLNGNFEDDGMTPARPIGDRRVKLTQHYEAVGVRRPLHGFHK